MWMRRDPRITPLVLVLGLAFPPAAAAQPSPKTSLRESGRRGTPSRAAGEKLLLDAADRERAVEFGRRVEQGMAQGDFSALEAALDYPALARGALTGLGLDDDEAREYSEGLVHGMQQRGGLARQLAHLDIRFLRVKDVDGVPKLIFGMISPEGAINYYLFDFEVRAGAVRLVDFYPLATGEPLTATLRRLLIPAIAQSNKSFLAKMFDRDDTRSILASYATFGRMGSAAQQGDWQAVVSGYESLDPAIRDDKVAMVMAISAYSMLGDDAKLTALSRSYERRYPGDASLPLMMADARIVSGQWRAALAGLDQVESMVGGDPFLDTTRAGIYLLQGDLVEALARARAGAEGAPGVELTHWQVATVAATAKDHPTVAEAFRELRAFGYYFLPETVTEPTYADFVTSAPAAKLFEEELDRMAADGVTLDDLLGD